MRFGLLVLAYALSLLLVGPSCSSQSIVIGSAYNPDAVSLKITADSAVVISTARFKNTKELFVARALYEKFFESVRNMPYLDVDSPYHPSIYYNALCYNLNGAIISIRPILSKDEVFSFVLLLADQAEKSRTPKVVEALLQFAKQLPD